MEQTRPGCKAGAFDDSQKLGSDQISEVSGVPFCSWPESRSSWEPGAFERRRVYPITTRLTIEGTLVLWVSTLSFYDGWESYNRLNLFVSTNTELRIDFQAWGAASTTFSVPEPSTGDRVESETP